MGRPTGLTGGLRYLYRCTLTINRVHCKCYVTLAFEVKLLLFPRARFAENNAYRTNELRFPKKFVLRSKRTEQEVCVNWIIYDRKLAARRGCQGKEIVIFSKRIR